LKIVVDELLVFDFIDVARNFGGLRFFGSLKAMNFFTAKALSFRGVSRRNKRIFAVLCVFSATLRRKFVPDVLKIRLAI